MFLTEWCMWLGINEVSFCSPLCGVGLFEYQVYAKPTTACVMLVFTIGACLQIQASGALLGPTKLFGVLDGQSDLSIQFHNVCVIKFLRASIIIGSKRFVAMGMRANMFFNCCIKFFWTLWCEATWDPTNLDESLT